MLSTVVTSGTGQRAQNGEPTWGKTGTTDDNGDAWFCGATPDITACIWVGYRDTVTPMETEYAGGPVDGGTFPALIFSQIATRLRGGPGAAQGRGGSGRLRAATTTRPRPRSTSTAESTEAVTPTTESAEPAPSPSRRRTGAEPRPPRRRPPTPATTVRPPRRPRAAASRPARWAQAAPARGRQRPREVRAPGGAEAPRQLGRLGDPDPRPGLRPRPLASDRGARAKLERRLGRARAPLSSSPIPSATVSLPGPEQSSRGSLRPRRRRIRLDPAGGLERADQHRGGAAVGLADRVQHAVDPVGEVDVGAAGRAEDRRGPRRQADVGVTGGIVALVALGLDDHPADPVDEQLAADQLARDLVHRAVEELGAESAQPASARRRSRVSRAAASCSASRADEVPPAESLESSQAPSRRTS